MACCPMTIVAESILALTETCPDTIMEDSKNKTTIPIFFQKYHILFVINALKHVHETDESKPAHNYQ
jgi:hypothetical protein